MRAHQQTPKKSKANPAKIELKMEAGRPVLAMAGAGAGGKTVCSCGGGCPRCKAKAGALHVLRRKAESHHHQGASDIRISDPGDAHERQAEQVADRVMRAEAPNAADMTAGPGEETRIDRSAEAKGQMKTDLVGAPVDVRQALATPGRPLDKSTRGFMEGRFGVGFGHVRVHDDGAAHRSAVAMGARAYTVGSHVVVRANAYRPDTASGKRLIAHELAHVVQQTGGTQKSRSTSLSWQPISVQPMIQRDLAIEPPHPGADGRTLTPAEMTDALDFNRRFLADVPNAADVIEMIRDVVGVSPQPAIVDEDFVRGVVYWQAIYGLTQDGKLGPTTARPLFREIGAEGVGRCEVDSGPLYRPAGPINVGRAAPRTARFELRADFKSDPANHIFPSCCEVRQAIQWDAAFVAASVAAGNGSVPHAGFPAAHPAGRWIEDRNQADDLRYGHRAGRWGRTNVGQGNRYLDNRRQNQAFGHRYRGEDNPQGLAADRGSWRFSLRVVDVCNGNRRVATSRTLVLNWL